MTEYLDRYPTMHEYAEGKRINPKLTDLISRADAIEAVCRDCTLERKDKCKAEGYCYEVKNLKALPSADAEPKWNCTANFVAEQLDRLRKMTDEEKWNFFREFFGMGDAVQGEWVDVENEPFCECSVCGSYIDNLDDDYAFCPRCGARMKGGAE